MYFNNFPSMLYPFVINGKTEYRLMKDITQNVRLRKQILANITLFDEYDIRDGETPEIIAERIYGSPEYHWVVMLCNERYDYIEDFPLGTYELEQHITKKYGAGNEYAVHHYLSADNTICDTSISKINLERVGLGYTSTPTVTIEKNVRDWDTVAAGSPATARAIVSDSILLTGSITGDVLTVGAVAQLLKPGYFVFGADGILPGTIITEVLTGVGTEGTFKLNQSVTKPITLTSLYATEGKLIRIELVSSGKGYLHLPTVTISPPDSGLVYGIQAIANASISVETSVSNYDYEFTLNETKRRIKLISPSLLNTILKNFNDLI